MRIAGFFFRSILFIGVFAALIYFAGGQLMMSFSLSPFLDTMRDLELSGQKINTYKRLCQTAPSSSTYSDPLAVQLRFEDDKKYVIELRCSLIEQSPVILGKASLPRFVSKMPASSGFYIDLAQPTKSTVILQSFAATKSFTVDTTAQSFNTSLVAEDVNPATSCTGWGYQCCDPLTQKGTGTQQTTGVTDCNANCFSACAPIPYIQSFTSDPYPENGTTVRMYSDSLTVTFVYTATVLGGDIKSVTITYGDGQTETATVAEGSFTHEYQCATNCIYTAEITAVDGFGNSSVVNDTSKLYIKRE